MTTIGFLGDTHGQQRWTRFALWAFAQRGINTVVQVGDFGIGKRGDNFHTFVETTCAEFGITLWVVPGNHENYDTIENIPENEDGTLHLTEHISILPRGFRWEWEGRTFVALGGAPSVDRMWRLEDERQFKGQKLWWIQEMITVDDVAKTVAGGYADVMVGHDAPKCVQIDSKIEKTKHMWNPVDLYYAAEGRELMEEATSKVQPALFFHGHYHFKVDQEKMWSDTGAVTRIMGLGPDRSKDAFAELNLDDMSTSHIPAWQVDELMNKYGGGV
ncbi:MAG: metallophosphoesterase family protein [Cetobacterium sp.]